MRTTSEKTFNTKTQRHKDTKGKHSNGSLFFFAKEYFTKGKMMKFMGLVIVAGLLFLSGCTEDTPIVPGEDLVVIRGFIYANEPVREIQLTSTLPLGSEDLNAPPVNDAEIILIKNGTGYQLEPSTGDSGYYHYGGSDLSIEAGDKLEIQINYEGVVITGETEVPPPPEDITISEETLILPKTIDPSTGGFDKGALFGELTVRWEKVEGSLYYITIDNVEQELQEIIIDMGFRTMNLSESRFNFISNPTSRDSMRVNLRDISHLGRHVVKVYRINQEYADLYQSRNQDSRDLNEPLTNIKNGLGVFSAFNSDSLFFYVKQE